MFARFIVWPSSLNDLMSLPYKQRNRLFINTRIFFKPPPPQPYSDFFWAEQYDYFFLLLLVVGSLKKLLFDGFPTMPKDLFKEVVGGKKGFPCPLPSISIIKDEKNVILEKNKSKWEAVIRVHKNIASITGWKVNISYLARKRMAEYIMGRYKFQTKFYFIAYFWQESIMSSFRTRIP